MRKYPFSPQFFPQEFAAIWKIKEIRILNFYMKMENFKGGCNFNKHTKRNLPSISLLPHQRFSPLPTWYRKQTQLLKRAAHPENQYP